MAYLHSRVETADGSGWLTLDWHNVQARVHTLETEDSRGDIQIEWKNRVYIGVGACMHLDDARALRDMLSEAIAEFTEGIDNGVDDTTAANGNGSDVSTPPKVSSYAQQLLNAVIAPTVPELPGPPKWGA
ncbi:hypothetical protein [Nocardia sp. NPDC050710]|uniref:hypothetical protein n=1 Tax=Nocardia sp. NPDC050710 TaxID=3157220 RepID=UPI0033EB3859